MDNSTTRLDLELEQLVFAGLTVGELESIKRANDAAGVPTLVCVDGVWVAV